MTRKPINTTLILTFVIMTVSFIGCLDAGTHGSIKYYEYQVDKYTLQKAVESIIANSKTVKRDTTKNYMVDNTHNRNDTIFSNYYNNGDTYVTINIHDGKIDNNYIFRYSGDKADWDTSKTSYLSIAYAHDKDGNGGSEGNGGISWYNWSLKRRLLKPFEREFISKIDEELKQKHVEGN